MSRTAWTVGVALVLVILSAAGALTRRLLLGPNIDGPHSSNAWRVTLIVTGRLQTGETGLRTPLPPDFRHQHIILEDSQSKELLAPRPKGKSSSSKEHDLVWQRSNVRGVQPFRVTTTFGCFLGMRSPTTGMKEATRELDAVAQKTLLQATPRIERDDPEIQKLARQLAEQVGSDVPRDLVRAFYDAVRDMENEPFLTEKTARDCLRDGGGDGAAKSRLLAALCRTRGIPARVLGGLILTADQEPRLHHWVEAHVNEEWLPMCPTNRHFDTKNWPRNYLILQLDDEPLVRHVGLPPQARGEPMQSGFIVQDLRHPHEEDGGRLWQRLTLHGLSPNEQHLARFLLLLPLAALIVGVFRTVIGVPTFGTFTPALLGLAFIDLKSLPVGLPIFVLLILAGWGMRHLLDRFHLLQVARASALLTLIVIMMLVLIVAASQFGFAATHFVSLFPLVILTHLVERFWTIEAEDGSLSSFKTLLGTMVVAVTVSVGLGASGVSAWMFRYPEALGVVLAVHLLLGRYTGYRISELYRFGDLIGRQKAEGRRQKAEGKQKTTVSLLPSAPSGALPNGNGEQEQATAIQKQPDGSAPTEAS
jgi:7 transmembrane helices usually fused to an inactive transglutaminase/Transglutaminase-like superfamily